MTNTQLPPSTGARPAGAGPGAASGWCAPGAGASGAGSSGVGSAGGSASPIAGFTVGLHRALDRLAPVPGWGMGPAEQREVLLGLQKAQARLEELKFRVLASADSNSIGDDEAYTSTAAWLADQARLERPKAHAEVRLAKLLDGHEITRRAFAAGRINTGQAAAIVAVIADLPKDVSDSDRRRGEAHLVAKARDFDAKALRRCGRHLLEVLAPDEADRRLGEQLEAEEREAKRKATLTFRPEGDGTVRGSFRLPVLHAQMLQKALQALTAPARVGPHALVGPDGRRLLTRELLGHGLMELIETYPVTKLPKAGGVNATIVVTMTREQLLGDVGVAGLDTGEEISAAEACRLAAAGAGIIPMVLGGGSVPLDVGRKRRFHDDYQRIAMAYRDKTCTVHGCDRPASWCHAHHDKAWADGGETSVANGRLLCGFHHRRIHDKGYRAIDLGNGKIRLIRQ